jgi:hypothetical protein
MFEMRVTKVLKNKWGWAIRTQRGWPLLKSITTYNTANQAKRWAKHWANKFSFEYFRLKGDK